MTSRQAGGDVEASCARRASDRRIGPRPDVRVQRADGDAVPGRQLLRLVEAFVPDAEARARAAGVRAVRRPAPEARIDPDARRRGRAKAAPKRRQLMERARVVAHAALDERLEPPRRHLRRELDALRGNADLQRTLHLVVAGGVDVESEVQEDAQDGVARSWPSWRSAA